MIYSLIIPVYKNSAFIEELIEVCEKFNTDLKNQLEVVFVIDGSPENDYQLLKIHLPKAKFKSQLISHSKNFGSFQAIKTGLINAKGKYFTTMAADLQEPPELIIKIFQELCTDNFDVVAATRQGREDGFLNNLYSTIFWKIYQHYVVKDIPSGGVDLFGCNQKVRNALIDLKENNSSLIGLLFWVGFKRCFIGYKRLKRKYGRSAWDFHRKIKYMADSIFAFTDLPVKLLIRLGVFGLSTSIILSVIAIISKISGSITVPGYTATLLIVSFFSSLNLLSFGIIGLYLWRTYENTKNRPNSIVMESLSFH